jgi:flagellar hook-associated protein 2
VSKTSETQTGTYSVYIAKAPEKAALLGGQTITPGGISADETLTFKYSNDKTEGTPTYISFSVGLSAGASVNSIVNSLNSAFATQDAALVASNADGKIRISSLNYGADEFLKVTSNRGNIAGQVGFNADGTSEDAGVDVVGSINGHAAEGTGSQLTSKSGFAEDGLTLTIESTQTGGVGTVTISSGIADKLPSSLATYTDSTTGVLKSRNDSIQQSIDTIESQIERMEKRFTNEEQSLKERFARLETLLAQYNTTSQYLSTQLESLTNKLSSNESS